MSGWNGDHDQAGPDRLNHNAFTHFIGLSKPDIVQIIL